MRIAIAIPSGGEISAETLTSVVGLAIALERGGISFALHQLHGADISDSRNRLAARFLADAAATHLLFIDSDIGFEPVAVQRLIGFDEPLVGAVYPKRAIDLERLVSVAREAPAMPSDAAISAALDHVYFNDAWEGEPPPSGRRDGFVRVNGIGMGLALIAREVFGTMIAHGAAAPVDARDGEGTVHDFFGCLYSNDGSRRYSEDLSFCRRWVLGCGGEVWADAASPVVHVGRHAYRGTPPQPPEPAG